MISSIYDDLEGSDDDILKKQVSEEEQTTKGDGQPNPPNNSFDLLEKATKNLNDKYYKELNEPRVDANETDSLKGSDDEGHENY